MPQFKIRSTKPSSAGDSYSTESIPNQLHRLSENVERKRRNAGPINQMGIVQKCRADMYNELWGCVPLNVDYPHTYSICRNDYKNCKN
ncbi:hypothetical protein TNIN_378341 [Trichonephila inaurata madagascariensis]|uniref:Uncharacterized protein n=1 Tax=Trichonephila inaurata madagascariensis TaxID=2747483 RepID=A0A8X6Y845_9ARAC|nr:hypothetical protein TNIN_378341 [Trichonephila inaurata madagascariensis]